jgi:hypothetical protein
LIPEDYLRAAIRRPDCILVNGTPQAGFRAKPERVSDIMVLLAIVGKSLVAIPLTVG